MAMATLNLKVPPRRMLNKREAAEYCGITEKRFPAECSVSPVLLPGGSKLYDIRDLDMWIDGIKGDQDESDDDILARLG